MRYGVFVLAISERPLLGATGWLKDFSCLPMNVIAFRKDFIDFLKNVIDFCKDFSDLL